MQVKNFKSFADCISDPLFMVTDDGLILAFNQSAKHDFQLKSDALGKSFASLFRQEAQSFRIFIRESLESDSPVMSAVDFINFSNHVFTFEGKAVQGMRAVIVRCFPKREYMNPLTSKLADEVKRREYIERQLKYSQAHARAVLETAADGIITINEAGEILSFNNAAERMFGFKAEEVVGENVSILMPESYAEMHNSFIDRYNKTHRPTILGTRRETVAQRKNGEVFHIDLGVSEIVVDNHRTFTGIIRDINRRIIAEKQVKEQEEEQRLQREKLVHVARLSTLGELAAGIAHEINQPLTAITNYAKVSERMLQKNWLSNGDNLQAALANNPITDQHLKLITESNSKISEQARRAGSVIHRLRDLIKKEASETECTEINQLIRDTMVLAETDTKVNNYELTFQDYHEPLYAMVDSVQIQQVILNFVRNGIEAMQEAGKKNGTIMLQIEPCEGNYLQVSVIDQGTGISKHKSDQLFDPFFTTKNAGLGLGLSISQNIIGTHGGKIGFENLVSTDRRQLKKSKTSEFTYPTFSSRERAIFDSNEISSTPSYQGAKLYFKLPILIKS